uniref:Kinesin motor domain-containing protein n=1 Tax=Chromera velia CCMP2878 TaxID=1169474 RepID=A0A0G4HMF2_9ALVE|eukprot:Cvel_7471.t1-p1 / transcript=Cvel_7471.t1 / gene=Cvel_7471 / organism=Chromera_velia_CCMP2878 / gene_product=Kinesin-like protein KIF13A, putative / transcript_product=Kinesin-like protein KIF13A, putative / location=Cvel_scaffold391:17598-22975(+) / protein_length=1037 / sequence_SO=supercontig / SO=protein_coding / is_pseudo=false
MSEAIRVAVRVRPFLPRETGEKCIVEMPDRNTTILRPDENTEKKFAFDYSFWSHDPNSVTSPFYSNQETIYNDLGKGVLQNALEGFNSCLFAYGQTGSGKSHSVLGTVSDPGLLPKVCTGLFEMIEEQKKTRTEGEFGVTVSFLEIYNERIKDLLVPPATKGAHGPDDHGHHLDVRQHPSMGIYIPGLTESVAKNYQEVQDLLDFGTKARTVGATNMNSVSSRSHAVFSIRFTQKFIEGGAKKQRRAHLHLVDLAGSERQKKTGAEGGRLKEGAMINQSLSNLGIVISTLAEGSKHGHVPFRNSKLTFLLSESLSGNSKTIMIAAISPAASNFEETLSTLRFAQTCKKVSTKAKKNEESDEKIVAALQAEIARLKEQLQTDLAAAGGPGGGVSEAEVEKAKAEVMEQLREREVLADKYKQSWEEMMRKTEEENKRRQDALQQMGLKVADMATAFEMDRDCPYLINISDDPLLTGCLMYFVKTGETTSIGSSDTNTITLEGLAVQPRMCFLTNTDNNNIHIKVPDGCEDSVRVLVNGRRVGRDGKDLKHHDRLVIGRAYAFRVVIPKQLEAAKDKGEAVAGRHAADDGGNWDVEAVMQEIVTDDSQDYQGATRFVEELRERIGDFKAQTFLRNFGKALRLVEEANDITQEMRPSDRLKFSLEVLLDVLLYDSDEPELIVRVWAGKSAKQRFQDAVHQLGQPKLFRKVLNQVISPSTGGFKQQDHAYGNILYSWELEKFINRLELMRGAYQIWYETGESPYEGRLEEDPWHEVQPRDMRRIREAWILDATRGLQEKLDFKEGQLRARDEQIERLRVALNSTGFLTSLFGSKGGTPGSGGKLKPLRHLSPEESKSVNMAVSQYAEAMGLPAPEIDDASDDEDDGPSAGDAAGPSRSRPSESMRGSGSGDLAKLQARAERLHQSISAAREVKAGKEGGGGGDDVPRTSLAAARASIKSDGLGCSQAQMTQLESINQQNLEEIVKIQSHAKEISKIFGNMEEMYSEWDSWMQQYKGDGGSLGKSQMAKAMGKKEGQGAAGRD